MILASCGLLRWRSTGFWFLAAREDFDDDHDAAASRARLARVRVSAPIRQAEVNAALDMVDRVEDLYGLYPEEFVGDGAYGNAET